MIFSLAFRHCWRTASLSRRLWIAPRMRAIHIQTTSPRIIATIKTGTINPKLILISRTAALRFGELASRNLRGLVRCHLLISFCAFTGRFVISALTLDIRTNVSATEVDAARVFCASGPTADTWMFPFSGNPSAVTSTPSCALALIMELIWASATETVAPGPT